MLLASPKIKEGGKVNSLDQKLVDTIALMWVSLGGDAEGFTYYCIDIKDAIEKLEEEKK